MRCFPADTARQREQFRGDKSGKTLISQESRGWSGGGIGRRAGAGAVATGGELAHGIEFSKGS